MSVLPEIPLKTLLKKIIFYNYLFLHLFLPLLTTAYIPRNRWCTLPSLSLSPSYHSAFWLWSSPISPLLPKVSHIPPCCTDFTHFMQCGTSQLKWEDMQRSVPHSNSTLMLMHIIVKNEYSSNWLCKTKICYSKLFPNSKDCTRDQLEQEGNKKKCIRKYNLFLAKSIFRNLYLCCQKQV